MLHLRIHQRAVVRWLFAFTAPLLFISWPVSPVSAQGASGWTKVAAPPSGGLLFDVTCTGNTNCWAVGQTGTGTLIEHYNGSSWTVVASPSPTVHDELISVTCTGPSNCWAVGLTFPPGTIAADLIEHFDGTSWSVVTGPGTGLYGVACVNSSDCWSSGNYRNAIEHFDGVTWTVSSTPTPTTTSGLWALYRLRCYTAADCWAVGATDEVSLDSQSLAEHWNGISWTIIAAPHPTSDDVWNDIACTNATTCWAVGCAASPATSSSCFGSTLVERWNGSSWRVVTTPNPLPTDELTGVACPTSTDCWAVGGLSFGTENLLEHYDGTSWSVDTSPVHAYSVTCLASGECWAAGRDIDHYTPLQSQPSPPPTATASPYAVPTPATGASGDGGGLRWPLIALLAGLILSTVGFRARQRPPRAGLPR
jgi:hypothetical protein